MSRSAHSLGKRLLPALAMTGAAAGLIALLDQPSSGLAGGAVDGGLGDPAALPELGATSLPSQPPIVSSTLPAVQPVGDDSGDDSGDDDGEDDGGQSPAQPTPTTQPAQPQATNPATQAPAAPTGACTGKTIDGPAVTTRWGFVQVEAVVSPAGQICDVGAIQSPDSRNRSVRINQEALPILHDQVMKAQSAKISGVSGATVTSEGYVRSLQAILDGSSG